MNNKTYKNQLKKIEIKLDKKYPKDARIFTITTNLDGKIKVNDLSLDETFINKDYKTTDEARKDIEKYATEKNIEPHILDIEIVDNSHLVSNFKESE